MMTSTYGAMSCAGRELLDGMPHTPEQAARQ